MKTSALLFSAALASMGLMTSCTMFGVADQHGYYRTETRQVKTCKYDVVTKQVVTGSGKSGMVQTIEEKVPRYKTVTRKVRVNGGPLCVRYYVPRTSPCGSTHEKTLQRATDQGGSGNPHIGMVPSMRKLAP
jgi:hypothetical protein